MRILVALSTIILFGCNAGDGARFSFTDVDPNRVFIIELSDANKIAHARRIPSGEEAAAVHVQGRVVKSKAAYNRDWSFHLDPRSIEFFEVAIEVCDSTMQYVEEHLAEVEGALLPNGLWCPWSSKLVREL